MDSIHGMAINGQAMELPNKSLDTNGWQQITGTVNNIQAQYQVKNGILYTFGYINADQDSKPMALKVDSRWKLPEYNSAQITNYSDGSNFAATKVYINYSGIVQQGYLLSTDVMGNGGSGYFNFSIPVI